VRGALLGAALLASLASGLRLEPSVLERLVLERLVLERLVQAWLLQAWQVKKWQVGLQPVSGMAMVLRLPLTRALPVMPLSPVLLNLDLLNLKIQRSMNLSTPEPQPFLQFFWPPFLRALVPPEATPL
jgi:hypothetical protein